MDRGPACDTDEIKGYQEPHNRINPIRIDDGRAMQLPVSIITGGSDVSPLRDRIQRYVLELSAQLKAWCKTERDRQEGQDEQRELEDCPEVPL
eukprot:g12130.t1